MTEKQQREKENPIGLNLNEIRPLIAILTPVSSHSYPAPWNTSSLPLFTKMLPSLIENLNCEFRYVVIIGYKKGDAYYDSPEVIHIIYVNVNLCDELIN